MGIYMLRYILFIVFVLFILMEIVQVWNQCVGKSPC